MLTLVQHYAPAAMPLHNHPPAAKLRSPCQQQHCAVCDNWAMMTHCADGAKALLCNSTGLSTGCQLLCLQVLSTEWCDGDCAAGRHLSLEQQQDTNIIIVVHGTEPGLWSPQIVCS